MLCVVQDEGLSGYEDPFALILVNNDSKSNIDTVWQVDDDVVLRGTHDQDKEIYSKARKYPKQRRR